MKATHTRVTPNIVTTFQMLNILFTIQSFEKKIIQNEEKIKGCKEGAFRLLPTYTQSIIKEYQGAIATWKERIEDEEMAYNKLLNELTLLSLPKIEINIPQLPELKMYENDIESVHHQNTCGSK
jgi:hypothetical protein